MYKTPLSKILRNSERYKNDKEYREKLKKIQKDYYKRNKEKVKERERERWRKWSRELNIYKNKHCKICNKLLYFETKGEFCRKHWCLKNKIKLKGGKK